MVRAHARRVGLHGLVCNHGGHLRWLRTLSLTRTLTRTRTLTGPRPRTLALTLALTRTRTLTLWEEIQRTIFTN